MLFELAEYDHSKHSCQEPALPVSVMEAMHSEKPTKVWDGLEAGQDGTFYKGSNFEVNATTDSIEEDHILYDCSLMTSLLRVHKCSPMVQFFGIQTLTDIFQVEKAHFEVF